MRIISNLILLAFLLSVVFVSIEYGARLALSDKYEKHKGSMLTTNEAVDSYKKNSRDKIDDDIKGNQEVVLFIGDSFTYGEGVERDDSYPEYYSRCAIRRGKDIKVLNLGIKSSDILDQTLYLKNILQNELANTNVVAIVQGLTQNDRYIKGSGLHPYEVCSQDYAISFIRKAQNYSFLLSYIDSLVIQKSHLDGRKMVIDPKTENCLRRNFDEVTDIAASKNIKLIRTYLYDEKDSKTSIDDMRMTVTEHLDSFKRDFPDNYVVLNEAFSTQDTFDQLYGSDNYHFNPVTNALIGEYLCDQIDI